MFVYTYITALIASIRRDEEGQGLAEYALILALISIAAIAVMILLGTQIGVIFGKVSTSL
jgi:pilus assembly protein Flp/PilA